MSKHCYAMKQILKFCAHLAYHQSAGINMKMHTNPQSIHYLKQPS